MKNATKKAGMRPHLKKACGVRMRYVIVRFR